MDRLVGLLTRAEVQLANGDSAAGRTIARIDVLMSTPVSQFAREVSRPQRPELSQVRHATAALGPMEHHFVNATREGIRNEEGFFRALIRSEFTRQGQVEGPRTGILGTADAAVVAGVTRKTIRAWVASGRLPPLGGQPYKFHRATVEAARDRKPQEQNVFDYDARAEQILDRKPRR